MQTHQHYTLYGLNFAIKSRKMKNHKLLYYVFNWLALAFLGYLLCVIQFQRQGPLF
jgi:hypothetical protein